MSNVANRIDYIKLPARDATKLATVKVLLFQDPADNNLAAWLE